MRSDRYAARLAGFVFLFLIATVITSSILIGGVEDDEISETLRNISEDELRVRLGVVLLIVGGISTLVLAAMLYAVTKHEDKNLAILACPAARWKQGSMPSASQAPLRCCP